jgi:hypothetical protein
MSYIKLAAILSFSCALLSAQNLPAGTALPVVLNSTLNAKSSRPGQKIEGKLKQEVRLAPGSTIKSGSRVTGHIVSVNKPGASGSRIVVQLDQLQDEHGTIPLNVSLRAMASSASVFQAGLPANTDSTDVGSTGWVTQQVGGDYVFRGRGYVASNKGKVGIWTGAGVWGRLTPAGDCITSENNQQEQSLWIFSTTACGVYGFNDLKLAQDGSAPPLGQITLESPKDIDVRGGSAWLLVVNAVTSAPAK